MGAGLRPGAKAPDKPPDPKAGAPVLDSTARCRSLSVDFDASAGSPFDAEAASGSDVIGVGVRRLNGIWVGGARCPGGQGPEAARRPASMRNRAASGQAEAKWMRIRAAFSTTRAPILSRRCPEGRELGPGERHPAGHGIAQGEHQPVGRGVQDEAELVGERALA